MAMQFHKAVKGTGKLRLALIGPSGSGKTYTGLTIGCALGQRVAVIDTERGSASKYADLFSFDTLELTEFQPRRYVEAIRAAAEAGFDVLVIDSLSHAWSGKGGALEMVDTVAARSNSKNTFAAWREVTPQHNEMVDAIIQAPMHIIATMRVKTEYVMEKDERTGKTAPRKVGLAPVQRDHMEYEFDVVGDLDIENTLVITKTRCPALAGQVIRKPDQRLAQTLAAWLVGKPQEQPQQKPAPAPTQQAPPAPKIGPEDLATVRKLMHDVKADYNAFLDHFKVRAVEDLTITQYQQAVKMLLEKKQRQTVEEVRRNRQTETVPPREPGIDPEE